MILTDEEALRVDCIDAESGEIGTIIEQLERELKYSAEQGRPGIGLAAPQIGISKNICIVRVEKYKLNLVNAKIQTGYDKAIFEQEGCLSFPGRFEKTLRYQEIYVSANKVEPHAFIAKGLLSVVAQHELDHLSGVLLPDVTLPTRIKKTKKLRPNDICLCGSGRKYKKCCGKN